MLLAGDPLRGLEHRARAGVAAVIADDVGGERVDRLHLRDDVEIAAGIELNVDVRERFQARAELAAGAPNPLGHRAHQPVIAREQAHDAIGFPELVLTEHHRSVPVQTHPTSLPLFGMDIGFAAPILWSLMVASPAPGTRFPTLGNQLFALASGSVTSVELVRRSLDAIEASQPTLNAFRVVLRESALAEAAAADRKRAAGQDHSTLPLLGIPIAVKDDVDVAGVPTRFGADGEVADALADAEVVRRLRAAGAVIVGKTNTCELGQWPFTSGPAFGHTRNPWSAEHTPGGSSGGSAAAVAAGLVPAALGSDGAGSVRIPAAWTNLVGIKPQRGRISTWPEAEAFHGLTVNGPLARTVADAALLLDVAAGPHAGDRHTPEPINATEAVGRDPGRLRIALSLSIPFTATKTALDPEVEAATRRMAATLRKLGH